MLIYNKIFKLGYLADSFGLRTTPLPMFTTTIKVKESHWKYTTAENVISLLHTF
jgi:hypothetical protein